MFDWTPEAVKTLQDMLAADKSAAEISKVLGTSRNSVIGKAHRLRLGFATRPNTKNKPAERKPVKFASSGRKPFVPPRRQFTLIKPVASVTPEAYTMPDDCFRVDLMRLENHTCRWPLDHDEEGRQLFCGAPEADLAAGRSYCPFHANLSRNAVQPAKRIRKDRGGYASANSRLLDMEAAE